MAQQQETWTILKVLEWTKGYLAEKGVGNARLEAEWMLCEILGLDRVGLYVNFDKPLTLAELAHFRGMVARRARRPPRPDGPLAGGWVARRARREPLQYILGTQEFMGFEFEVAPGVLIPRHDTETLVTEAVRLCGNARKVLDIGVGSGCIAVSLARLLPDSEVAGVERSPEALAIARRNAEKNGVTLALREGSLFEPFAGERFDLVVSNPPYIPTCDLAGLQPEVQDFEPRGALDGGTDGLDFYRIIIPAAPDHLNPGGWLLFEVGIGQAAQVAGLFGATGRFCELFTAKDPGGNERVVGGRLA